MTVHICRCTWPVPHPHVNYGECLRSKGIGVAPSATPTQNDTGRDGKETKAFERRLSDYRDARKQGVMPQGTRPAQVRAAMELSDKAGAAFDASTGTFAGQKES